MRLHRLLTALIAAFMVLSLAPLSAAQPPGVPPDLDVPLGRWPEERGRSADAPGQQPAEPAPSAKLPGQPRNDVIEEVPFNPNDASIPIQVIPYHDIPPMLSELQGSDRISVEIIGESVLGRDLHLVVATSPMTDAEWDEWQRLSDLRYDDPDAAIAAFEAGEYDGWKTPLLINNNIHGNEWEGTDSSLAVQEELASSTEAGILEILDRHVVAFVVTMNPDGRVAGTRGNANGFDMNRDFVTVSQPEVRAVRDQMVRYSPLTMLDMHGYVWPTLIEPTTGPHGDNYEYDLYIPKALRNGLAMEARVVSDVGADLAAWDADTDSGAIPPPVRTWDDEALIPYRDLDEGWDDWPPIFTPMYGMYHGSIGHTIEVPIGRPAPPPPSGPDPWTPELRERRADINTRVGIAAIEANIDFATENQADLLANQLEWFRRGADGESARPIDDQLSLDLACCENNEQANANTFLQEYPRAYVIPVGSGQRDDAAAARLVQFMIDNDVEVHRAWRPFSLNGQNVGAGSYVVDMLQAKRGLANMLLEVGRDVTQEFNTMYDISAWSHGFLWGATANRIADGTLDSRALRPVTSASPSGSVAPGNLRTYGLVATSVAGIQAVNFLLDNGVAVLRTSDGTFAVPGSARPLVREAADTFGVAFTNLPPGQSQGATPVSKLQVGVSAPFDEVFALTRMGFDLTSVTHTGFNNGSYQFSDFDAFFVSTTAFNPLMLNATQAAAFEQWLADGGTVVGRGGGGTTFNMRAGLLDVTFDLGRGDANGIVAVENDPASPITSRSLPSSFVTAPRYFTSVGDGVRVDQRLEDGAFFLAGHWVGQEAAAGQAVVVSGQARGANVTLFGTEPLYRTHPEGLYEQVANALWWKG